MKSIRLMIATLVVSSFVHAGEIDGGAVLGSALGAATGSVIGSAVGGKEGAIIGGGAGGAVGAAVGSESGSPKSGEARVVVKENVYIDGRGESYSEHSDNGKHKGQHKNKHKHGRDD